MNILITYSMQPLFSTVDLVAKKGQISNLATTAPHVFHARSSCGPRVETRGYCWDTLSG